MISLLGASEGLPVGQCDGPVSVPARAGVAKDLAMVKEEDCRVLFAKPNPLGIVLWTTGGFAFSAGAFFLKRLGARGFPPLKGPCLVLVIE
jgi:hypothetical protein